MNLGSMMACNNVAFNKAIIERRSEPLFRYLEVGCAYGVTCIGISTYLESTREGRWQSVMIDKKDGGWAFNPDACRNCGRLWGSMTGCGANLDRLSRGKIYLNDEGSDKLLPVCPNKFDLVLIDACHSKECCTHDFLAVEPLVKESGYVFFHDANPKYQGLDVQPHCSKPIGVRAALEDLGLMTGKREGWKLVDDIEPNDDQQRGCVVVQRL